MMKKTIPVLFAFLLLPLVASAAPGRGNPGDILTNPRALARYLKLTPAQIETTKQLFQTLHSTTKPLHEQQKPLREQLRTQLDGADACAAGATLLQLEGLKDQIRDARQDFDDAFSAILTPEQLAKYEALKDAVRIGEEESE